MAPKRVCPSLLLLLCVLDVMPSNTTIRRKRERQQDKFNVLINLYKMNPLLQSHFFKTYADKVLYERKVNKPIGSAVHEKHYEDVIETIDNNIPETRFNKVNDIEQDNDKKTGHKIITDNVDLKRTREQMKLRGNRRTNEICNKMIKPKLADMHKVIDISGMHNGCDDLEAYHYSTETL